MSRPKFIVNVVIIDGSKSLRESRVTFNGHNILVKDFNLTGGYNDEDLSLTTDDRYCLITTEHKPEYDNLDRFIILLPDFAGREVYDLRHQTRIFFKGQEIRLKEIDVLINYRKTRIKFLLPKSEFEYIIEKRDKVS